MNSVLKEILETKKVSGEHETLPLLGHVDEKEGALLSRVFESVRPLTSLEVGFAYGVSTLYICDALARAKQASRHIVVDPFQSTQWKGIGLRNVRRAGYERFVELREERSEIALPQLLAEDTALDAAFIDGWHTFDHALVDFFYINKMLRVGGIVVIDDATYPSVGKLVDHILTYGCYELYATPDPTLPFFTASTFRLAKRLAYHARLKPSRWPSAVALRKVAPDERDWKWYRAF